MHLYSQYHSVGELIGGGTWARCSMASKQTSTLESSAADPAALRVVVSLGTLPRWQFRRLVEACLKVIPDGSHVLWQIGYGDRLCRSMVG